MAQKQYPIINNFSRGELSSRIEGRVDTPGYYQGCKIMQNCIMVAQGGAEKRPGTVYLGEAYGDNARLIPFEVNDNEIYQIEIGHLYIKIWDVKNKVLLTNIDNESNDTIVTEFDGEDIADIQVAQTENKLFFAHNKYRTRIFSREYDTSTDHVYFKLETMGFNVDTYDSAKEYHKDEIVEYNGEYYKANKTITAITPSDGDWTSPGATTIPTDITGNVISYSASTTYTAGNYVVHNKKLWRCKNSGTLNKEPGIKVRTATDDWSTEIVRWFWSNINWRARFDKIYGKGNWKFKSLFNVFWKMKVTVNIKTTVYVSTIYWDDVGIDLTDIATEDSGGTPISPTLYSFVASGAGVGGWDNTGNGYDEDMYAYDPSTFRYYRCIKDNTTATLTDNDSWDRLDGNPLFSIEGDFPAAVAFMDQRLLLGGTLNHPQTVMASRIRDFSNFTIGTNDDDAYSFSISLERSSRIKWMIAKDVLMIGTSSDEILITGGTNGITPTNVRVLRQSSYGSAYRQAVFVADTLLFFQKGGRKLREYIYSNDNKAYIANDLTFYADHITENGIKSTSYQYNPDSILWSVKNDGQLIGLTYDRNNKIFGWHSHETDGLFENVSSITGESDEDELWFVIKRNINGSDKQYIEYMAKRRLSDQTHAIYSDSAIVHIEGDQFIISNITYSASSITITYTGTEDFVDGDDIKITQTDIVDLDYNVFQVHDLNTTAKTFTLYDSGSYFTCSSFIDPEKGYFSKVTDTITSLAHLEGETVDILGDGAVFPSQTVSSGTITIRSKCTTIIVGLNYEMRLQPESIELPGFSTLGAKRRISKAILKLYETLGGYIGPDIDTLEEMRFRSQDVPFGAPPSLFTGAIDVPIDSSSETEASILIYHNQPLPITILAIITDITYSR